MYRPKLDLIQTERAIKTIKTVFEDKPPPAPNLTRTSAPPPPTRPGRLRKGCCRYGNL